MAEVKCAEGKSIDECLEEAIGGFGKFQFIICIIMFSTRVSLAFHQFMIIFIAPHPTFYCLDDGQNITGKCPCKNIEFDRSVFKSTIITEWNLVCGRSWMVNIPQVILMLGVVTGGLSFGALSDRFGRRPQLLISICLQLLSGMLAGLSINFWLFVFLRFFIGVSVGGIIVVGFVLLLEFISNDKRVLITCLYQLPFIFGHLSISFISYFLRTWNHLQYVLTGFTLVMLVMCWNMPESVRWLIANGETEDAIRILEKAARRNRLSLEHIRGDLIEYQNRTLQQQEKGNILTLIKTPRIRHYTMIMGINWLICGFGYHGIVQYIGNLGGNIFLNVAISAAVSFVGAVIAIPFLANVGRKPATISTLLVSGLAFIVFACIPSSIFWLKMVFITGGSATMFIAFVVTSLYTTEVYPTFIRNVGVGVCSTMSKVGSMIAPFVATMDTKSTWIPPVIFGVVCLLGAILSFVLTETRGMSLPSRISDVEHQLEHQHEHQAKETHHRHRHSEH